jgi:anti-anti-sigma factor
MEIDICQQTGVIHLSGDLEILAAGPARLALLESLERRELALDLSQVSHCDTAGAQLLYAACRTAEERGKTIRFERVSPAVASCWSSLGLPDGFLTNAATSLV